MSTFDHAAYRAAELRLHEAAVEYARVGGGVALSNLAGVAREYAKATPALDQEREDERNARGES